MVKFFIPAFATEYGKALESGGPAEADDMLIIEPFLFLIISGAKILQPSMVPVICEFITSFHSSREISRNGFGLFFPAPFIKTSKEENSLSISLFATDFIEGFPKYSEDHCPKGICQTRFYGSISL